MNNGIFKISYLKFRRFGVGLVAVLLLCPALRGENEALVRAEKGVQEAKAKAESDPARPIYHFHPPANWMNDPNGPIFYKGFYHIFYQHNPFGDGWGHMHWGHARSKDLAHWEHLPIALWPSEEAGEDGVWSGCCTINGDGKPMIFYTSVGPKRPARDAAEQWAALAEDEDLIIWKKHPANPILPQKVSGETRMWEWRDPFVFDFEGHKYMVLGGNFNDSKGGQATVALYRAENPDLTQWTHLGIVFQHPSADAKDIECPSLFKLQERWVLIVSVSGHAEYFVGQLDSKEWKFKAEKNGVLDAGDFYAPNSMEDGNGRRILWGWVRGFKEGKGWNGCMSLSRVLTIGPDGDLKQSPAPEIETLRTGMQRLENLPLRFMPMNLNSVKDDAMEIEGDVKFEQAIRIGFRLRCQEEGSNGIEVSFGRKELNVAGTRVPLDPPIGDDLFHFRIFCDQSVLEVYGGDGRTCVTRVIDFEPEHRNVQAFSRGGQGSLKNIKVSKMGSAFTEVRSEK